METVRIRKHTETKNSNAFANTKYNIVHLYHKTKPSTQTTQIKPKTKTKENPFESMTN